MNEQFTLLCASSLVCLSWQRLWCHFLPTNTKWWLILFSFISSIWVKMIPGITTLTFSVLWAAGKLKMYADKHVQNLTNLKVDLCVICLSFCISGLSQSVLITQWPHYISSPPRGSVQMYCYQNDTDYEYLYWYKQLRGKSFQLIVSIIAGSPTLEKEFESGFKAARSETKQWSLTITSVKQKDEAVYLCAASPHSAVTALRSVTKTHSRDDV